MELNIGQEGFEIAPNNLLETNPLINIRCTTFSYLYLAIFICEGMRILYIHNSIFSTFVEKGMTVPEHFFFLSLSNCLYL